MPGKQIFFLNSLCIIWESVTLSKQICRRTLGEECLAYSSSNIHERLTCLGYFSLAFVMIRIIIVTALFLLIWTRIAHLGWFQVSGMHSRSEAFTGVCHLAKSARRMKWSHWMKLFYAEQIRHCIMKYNLFLTPSACLSFSLIPSHRRRTTNFHANQTSNYEINLPDKQYLQGTL